MNGRKNLNFPPKVLYKNRYCNQDNFSILVCGGRDKSYKAVKSVYKLDGRELKCKTSTSMPNKLKDCKSAVVNSELFILGGYLQNKKFNKLIIKFCNKTKTWSSKVKLGIEDSYFCIISFKKKLYVVYATANCFVYNSKNDEWNQLASTKEKRFSPACTVFEGKIVLCGGYNYNSGTLKSVVAYDYYENKWTDLPDMNERRIYHASVSMGNKFFVIGRYDTLSSEVFDSISRKFTFLRSTNLNANKYISVQAVSIGNNIVLFFSTGNHETKVYVYDVINNHCREVYVNCLENLIYFSCVKCVTK